MQLKKCATRQKSHSCHVNQISGGRPKTNAACTASTIQAAARLPVPCEAFNAVWRAQRTRSRQAGSRFCLLFWMIASQSSGATANLYVHYTTEGGRCLTRRSLRLFETALKCSYCPASIASPTLIIVASSKCFAITCTPIGSPAFVSPHGTLIPQIPASDAATE